MIISANLGGLCNRIKSLVSCCRLADQIGVHWVSNNHLKCSFDDLFENDFIEYPNLHVNTAVYDSWRLAVLEEDVIQNGFSTQFEAERFSDPDPHGRNIDFEYDRIPMNVREAYGTQFKMLKFRQGIREMAASFAQNFSPYTISVQIRSWRDSDPRHKRLFSLEKFVAHMTAAPRSVDFFVSSDSSEVISSLRSRFGNRVLVYPRRGSRKSSRLTREGVHDDLVELLLLAKNKTLIGSYISTFSEVAWWLGECKAKVTIA